MFLPHPRVKVSIVGSLRDREVACSASDRQGSNFESCVWRTVSSQSSHHPQEVLLAQLSLYVHKGGLKPDSFHFLLTRNHVSWVICVLADSERTRIQFSAVFTALHKTRGDNLALMWSVPRSHSGNNNCGVRYVVYTCSPPATAPSGEWRRIMVCQHGK